MILRLVFYAKLGIKIKSEKVYFFGPILLSLNVPIISQKSLNCKAF